MFIPVNDQNPLKNIRLPYMTWTLILANIAVFVWQMTLDVPDAQVAIAAGGLIPNDLFTGVPTAYATLITYMFLHGDIWHLAGNMVFLYIFGDNVEDATGHILFVPFYMLCGIAAGLTHSLLVAQANVPLIGASGATAGLVGAYLLLHPRVNIWVLALGRIPLKLRAYWVIGAWLLWQIYFIATRANEQVAWWAHVGGFAAGALLIVFMRKGNVKLFDRDLPDDPEDKVFDDT